MTDYEIPAFEIETEFSPTFTNMVVQACIKTWIQGERCVNNEHEDNCMYQSGCNRCVVGHMMTDDEIAEFEKFGGGIRGLVDNGWRTGKLDDDEIELLKDLQKLP